MSDDVTPRGVFERLNTRIGKTRDPFARLQLQQFRDDLRNQIDALQSARKQYKVIEAGRESVGTDDADAMAERVEADIQQATQEVTNKAKLYADLLDRAEADDTFDIAEYLQQRQAEQQQAARQQLAALNQQ